MDGINWRKWGAVMEQKVGGMDGAAEFVFHATNLVGAPYAWGAENVLETDCSGTVCYALWMMGYNVRTNAQGLFDRVFPAPVERWEAGRTCAVFYRTLRGKLHGNREVPQGTIIHVTPVVGRNVVLNAGASVELRTAADIRRWYEARSCVAIWREIDWDAVRRVSDSGQHAWDVDPILYEMRA